MAAEGVTVLQTEMSWKEDDHEEIMSFHNVAMATPTLPNRPRLSNLCYLLQQLKLLYVVVPLDSQAVWFWFQTPPHVRQAPTNNALPSVTAQEVT